MVHIYKSYSDKEVKEICVGGKNIRSVYTKINGNMIELFKADLMYFGFSPFHDYRQAFTQMQSIVARKSFGPIMVKGPSTPMYFFLFNPKRYDDNISFVINDMACTPVFIGTTHVYDTEYNVYSFGRNRIERNNNSPAIPFSLFKTSGNITIEGKK